MYLLVGSESLEVELIGGHKLLLLALDLAELLEGLLQTLCGQAGVKRLVHLSASVEAEIEEGLNV